jgi:hypothetical protein
MTDDRAWRTGGTTAVAVSALTPDDTRPSDGAQRYFADEIAIDFPSVVSAVERIRHGLRLAERRAGLPVQLCLSSHEARHGTTTHLSVPVRATCRACGGRGESWADDCSNCDGTGEQLRTHSVQVRVPAGVVDGATFGFSVTPRSQPSTRIALRIVVSPPPL